MIIHEVKTKSDWTSSPIHMRRVSESNLSVTSFIILDFFARTQHQNRKGVVDSLYDVKAKVSLGGLNSVLHIPISTCREHIDKSIAGGYLLKSKSGYSVTKKFVDIFYSTHGNRLISKSSIPERRHGFIYVMKDEGNSLKKIGFSKDPIFREKTLQSEKPSISMLEFWRGTTEDESLLHRKFKSKRIRGEWFDLNDDDLRFMKSFMSIKLENNDVSIDADQESA